MMDWLSLTAFISRYALSAVRGKGNMKGHMDITYRSQVDHMRVT